MNLLGKTSKLSGMAIALLVGMAYLLPAGLASAYRLSERAIQEEVLAAGAARMHFQKILVEEIEDCAEDLSTSLSWH